MRFVYLIILLGFSTSALGSPQIKVNTTNGRTYYHLALILSSKDFRLTHPSEYFDPQWPESTSGSSAIGENGYFVVYIAKSVIPVSAPNCKSDWIKVTMRGTSDNPKGIASKRKIWRNIESVKEGKSDFVEVVIELNSYVEFISKSPLKLELKYRNSFFRTAWGEYIDHTGPVDSVPNAK